MYVAKVSTCTNYLTGTAQHTQVEVVGTKRRQGVLWELGRIHRRGKATDEFQW